MQQNQTRITVTLSNNEWTALRNSAINQCRTPRDQARFILRETLIQKPTQEAKPTHAPAK